ncbi:MAG: hypothetical protein J6L85_01520 [Clostridia bacterium]|nr:hypothetical protein [Clostridia bacterium]
MKKYISLLLVTVILISAFALPISAAETSGNSSDDNIAAMWEHAIAYTCVYDIETKRVKVSGTLDSEVFADHSDWSLCVYSIAPGSSEKDVVLNPDLQPLAEAMVSIKFEFTFKADKIADRYSRYAIFLKSPKNELVLTAKAQYPDIAATFEYPSSNRYYKGLQKDFSSFSTEVEAGTTILPIQLNTLFSDTSTSLFVFVDQKQYFFEETVIKELDVAMRSMSVTGSRIYLRLLYSVNGSESYSLPDMYDAQMLVKTHAVVTYLAERYGDVGSGKLSGIILGKGWDDASSYNYAGAISTDEYVDKCVAYTAVVANASRTVDPSLDIVIPLTASGFAKNNESAEKNTFKQFVESLLYNLDISFYSGINCSFLLDCTETPKGINGIGKDAGVVDTAESFYAGAHKAFSDYLVSLEYDYQSTPNKYMFVWTPNKNLSGNELAAAYAYSYYALSTDSTVYAFVVDFSKNGGNQSFRDMAHVMKYIDTNEGGDVAKNLPKIFGQSTWKDIFGTADITNTGVKHCYSVEALVNSTESFMGEFTYFDFTSSSIVDGWHTGAECTGVKIDYTGEMDKALRADFVTDGAYGMGELLYVAEYSENMIYTPTLRFKLGVTGQNDDALYEIKITVGNSDNRLESSCIVKAGEVNDVFVDISKYIPNNMVDYIRISARPVDGGEGTCSLWLYSLCGLSRVHEAEELEALVLNEREKIRHMGDDEEERQYWGQIALAFGVILIIGALGAGLFISFRRENSSDEEKGNGEQ